MRLEIDKFTGGYLLLLVALVVVQPLLPDSIQFYVFIVMAVISCFLPRSLPFPIFLSLCVMLLLLVDMHSPIQSTFLYLTSIVGGIFLVSVRITFLTVSKQNFEGSKAQLDAFWDTIVDGLVVIDDKATIVAINPAVEKLFGYQEHEMLGQNVKMLMPHHYAVEHDGYVNAYNTTGDAKIIGTGREVEGKRKNGSTFPMYLAVSKFDEGGNRYYCGIVRDMTIENEIRESLVEARDKAESASYAKTKFLSSISHEVRTPLNAILGFTQLLGSTIEKGASPEQQDYMNHIQSSGEHLMALINEVLDMSQIESGRMHLSIERVNVMSVLSEVIDMVKPLAEKFDVSLSKAADVPDNVAVLADRVRLKQALLNLSTNAIKYNKPGGRADWQVTLLKDSHKICFEIADTGVGISPDQHVGLFEPFNRLGREASIIEGTGIGLSVTKTVLEAMDGTIDFESQLGVGTKFRIELPAAFTEVVAYSDGEQQAPEIVPIVRETGAGDVTILYIEDNPANTVLMQRFIGKLNGITLLHAPTAEVGLEMVQATKVDLILMDLNLPGMDGFEAQVKLSRDERTKNIPVVAVSADVNPSTIKRAMNVGFRKFISKPFNLREAQQTIQSFLPGDENRLH